MDNLFQQVTCFINIKIWVWEDANRTKNQSTKHQCVKDNRNMFEK